MTTKHLGLLMSDNMALACWIGRKTVTRRPLSVQPPASIGMHPVELTYRNGELLGYAASDFPVWSGGHAIIPGAGTATVGGRVWIRECWAPMCRVADPTCFCEDGAAHFVEYRADTGNARPGEWPSGVPAGDGVPKWRPSIHMPKWAARTWGRIVSVRPERLQDITEDDARREGFAAQHPGGLASLPPSCKAAFVTTWNELYEPRGLGWNANPWVWRIEWERIERPQEDR